MASMRQFIKDNRSEIDRLINENEYQYDGNGGKGCIPEPPPKRNDSEREGYIINYEPLYLWAKGSGVKV